MRGVREVRVLITGGAGFLGTHLALALCNRGDEVVVYEDLGKANQWGLQQLRDKVKIVNGNILDAENLGIVAQQFRPEKILHLAAIVGAAQSLGIEKQVAEVNVLGAINALNVAKDIDSVDTYLEVTSEEVYGQFASEPANEDHPARPVTPYGITKYASEAFTAYYSEFYGLNAVSVRTSWVYGPGLPRERIPRSLIRQALSNKSIFLPFGGDHRIDYVFVEDFVRGVLLVLDRQPTPHQVYNIASGTAYSVAEVARFIQEIIPGTNVEIGPGLLRPDGIHEAPQKGALDISRACSDLGYRPEHDLPGGLRRYAEYLADHEY